MLFGIISAAVVHAVVTVYEEDKAFRAYIATLPESERQAAIDRRRREWEAKQKEDEHQEYLEAVKPHNLWSFLGLGRK
jgi:hypothetical protein